MVCDNLLKIALSKIITALNEIKTGEQISESIVHRENCYPLKVFLVDFCRNLLLV